MVINYGKGGGAIKQEGGGVKFYPYTEKKGGGGCRNSFSHAEAGMGGGGGGDHTMF